MPFNPSGMLGLWNYYTGDEDKATVTMAVYGVMLEFDGVSEWSEYVKRLEHYFKANKVQTSSNLFFFLFVGKRPISCCRS